MDRPWLLVLPVELLTDICSRFCVHCVGDPDLLPDLDHPARYQQIAEQQCDLASLSRVSRTLHAVATPFLYHVLATDKLRPHLHMRHQRTLHGRPDLAAHVKRAVFLSYPDASECDSIVNHLVARLGIPPPDGWIVPKTVVSYTKCGNRVESEKNPLRHQFMIEMALSLTSNLEYLSLSVFGARWGTPNFGENMLPSSSMPALKTLHLSSLSARFGVNSVSLLLQKAPNLRLLRLDGCGWADYHARPVSGLRSLPVLWVKRPCFDSREDLAALFASCGNLQALIYHHSQHLHTSMYARTPEDMAVALQHCHRTLRYLEIQWGLPRPHQCGLISSLKLFSSLETLIIDAACVFSDTDNVGDGQGALSPTPQRPLADLLPNSIRQLLLFCVNYRMYQNIADLAQIACQGAFPDLKIIWIDQSSFSSALLQTDLRTLEANFALAGISLIYSCHAGGELFSDPEALLNRNYRLPIVGRFPDPSCYSNVAFPGA